MKRSRVKQLRHRLTAELRTRPSLYTWALIVRPTRRARLTRAKSSLVIDGFPRSANTYAFASFTLVNPNVRVAHHLHSVAQFVRAADLGVPAILLLREPADAVVSAAVRQRSVTPDAWLREYIRFHGRLLDLPEPAFLVAPFAQVTSDFSQTIAEVNRRWSTHFNLPFSNDAGFEAACLRLVDEMDKKDTGKDRIDHASVARPSRERRAYARQLREHLLASRGTARMLQEAIEVHQSVYQRTVTAYVR